jgi:hypothetical protein
MNSTPATIATAPTRDVRGPGPRTVTLPVVWGVGDNSVGIATRYGFNNRGLIPCGGDIFVYVPASIPSLGPTRCHRQWVLGIKAAWAWSWVQMFIWYWGKEKWSFFHCITLNYASTGISTPLFLLWEYMLAQIVGYRPVARQLLRNRQLYNSRC